MKFRTNASTLENALNTVKGAVPRNATLPILETILFEAADNTLQLTATDLEVSVVDVIDVEIEEEGAVAIPAQRLIDALRHLPDIPVVFEVDDRLNIQFRTEKGTYKLVGEDPDEYPEIPNMKGAETIDTSTEVVHRIIGKTLFAASTDDLRPAMMGVLFDIGPDESTFVATDGHQLAEFKTRGVSYGNTEPFIVPEDVLSLVKKLPGSEECTIASTGQHVQFRVGNTTIVGRLVNEQYPSYKSVIPADNNKVLRIDKGQFLATVKRVSIFSSETTNQIALHAEDGTCTIRAEDIGMSSEASETIACEYDSDKIEIGFNSKYLADIASNVDGDEVQVALSTPNKAGIVTPVQEDNGESLRMLVMPIMLNSYA